MQDQESALQAISEMLDIEHGPSSSSSGMDLSLRRSNNVNAENSLNLPSFGLPTNESNVAYPTPIRHDESTLVAWQRGQPSSGNHELRQQTNHNEAKNEATRTCPMNDGAEPSLRLDWEFMEPNGALAINGIGVNRNDDSTVSGSFVNCLGDTGNNGRSNLYDGRRSGLKRKASEGSAGESSSRNYPGLLQGAVNGSQDQQGPVSVETLPCLNISEELYNQRSGIGIRDGSFSNALLPQSSEGNTHLRTIPMYFQDSALSYNPWGPVSTSYSRESNVMPAHQILSGYVPANSTASPWSVPEVASTSQTPNLPTHPRNVSPYTPIGSVRPRPSSMFSTQLSGITAQSSPASLEETNPRTAASGSRGSLVAPLDNEVVRLARRWNRSNMNTSGSQNIASSSQSGAGPSGVHSAPSTNWIPEPNSTTGPSRRLSTLMHQNFLASGSDSGSRNAIIPSVRPAGPSSSRQHMPLQLGGRHRYFRSRLPIDRQGTGVPGVPLSIGSSVTCPDWSRLSSQIRNLILARQGNHMTLEVVVSIALQYNIEKIQDMIINHSIIYGVADLHDRHRDMRLDVDNMSYEELLALEERIGNVSTGLSEETIFKCLKQRIYASSEVEDVQEVEPCCICQEEYLEGEDLGKLDCGHDFHTACIKQWLMIKNLCPICKTTALVA